MSDPAASSTVSTPVPPAAGPAPRGLFVVFEGGDGAGKSTQVTRLAAWLSERGRPPVLTREPGGTELGRHVRELLLHGGEVAPRAEALLFAADRAHHVATLVRPALERGEIVVSDRYLDSSVAYQGGGRDLPAEEVRDLSLWAAGGLVPHVTVLLDVDPATGRARVGRRGDADRMEAQDAEFHARVRARFLDLAAADPGRYLVLDAAAGPDAVHAAVRERLAPLLADGTDATAEIDATAEADASAVAGTSGTTAATGTAGTTAAAGTSDAADTPGAPAGEGA